MKDVREAAERVKEFGEQADSGIVHEAGVVARAYLAETDEALADEVFFDVLGWAKIAVDDNGTIWDSGTMESVGTAQIYRSPNSAYSHVQVCVSRHAGSSRLDNPTLGQVRTLLRLFRIPLKETP